MNLLQKLIDILDMGLQGLESALQVTLIGTNEVSILHSLTLDRHTFLRPCYLFLKVFSLAQLLYKCMSDPSVDKRNISASRLDTWSSFFCI